MKIKEHFLVGAKQHTVPHKGGEFDPLFLAYHYTAGGTAASSVSWWQNPESHASAHLIIDRDGALHQCVPFDERAWHIGGGSYVHWTKYNSRFKKYSILNKHTIGIELVNWGPLTKQGGRYYSWSGTEVPESEVIRLRHAKHAAEIYWHTYTPVQLHVAAQVGAGFNSS